MMAWLATARLDIKPFVTVCELPNDITELRWQPQQWRLHSILFSSGS